jgi:uroporphyrin-III C-methyltransferase
VGKRAGQHSMSQEQINALLVHKAHEHRTVVRLKGGDPFIFGRGGEELLHLQTAGVPVEVVPGISSAIAAPAAAGVPVTQRGVSSSVAIVSGHAASCGDGEPDWLALARMDTVVILMGLHNVAKIAGRLIQAGRDPYTPAMAVAHGTTCLQQVVVATLATLAQRVTADLPAPATIVVGQVVALAHGQTAAPRFDPSLFAALPAVYA